MDDRHESSKMYNCMKSDLCRCLKYVCDNVR